MSTSRRKRVLITGAGSGIGRATALVFAETGCDLELWGRRPKPLESLEWRAIVGRGEARGRSVDLSERSATDRALNALADRWDELDVLVLNAGVSQLTPLDDAGARDFDEVLELNLTANYRVLRSLVPRLVDGGRVILISSVLARFGIPKGHAYCASKAGLVGLARSLALDLAPRGITVNAILPGWVETAMALGAIEAQAPGMDMTPEEARRFFEGTVPQGRFLDPSEIARTVLFLSSTGARGITGQALNVCGGVMA